MANYTEEQLASMSAQEREAYDEFLADEAAMQEDDDYNDDFDDNEAGESQDDDQDDNVDDQSGDKAADTDPDEATEQGSEHEQGQSADADEPAATVENDDNQIDFTAPAHIQEKIDAIKGQRAELLEQFDDGDLTREEYQTRLNELQDEENQHVKAQAKAEMAIEDAQKDYFVKVNDFLGQHPQYQPGTLMYNLLDERVKQLQTQGKDPFAIEALELAHKQLQKELGIQPPETDKQAEKQKAEAVEKDKPRPKSAQRAEAMPPSLNSIPSSDINDAADQNGHFAYLDRLSPVELEKRLAKMSPEQQEAYLQYGG